MRVRLPLMIQDLWTSLEEEVPVIESYISVPEDFFLDGPVTKRLAVLDFSPTTGELLEGAKLIRSVSDRNFGWYSDEKMLYSNYLEKSKKKLFSPTFMQTSVFATVLKTIYLFEGYRDQGSRIDILKDREQEVLGRQLNWAFNAPQLLIIPRAGEQANAFYHRDSHSLQFFFFRSPIDPKKKVYTCLSRDIVAHETAHAILDGIAPDLLDACTPQSLAIHEAIADFTAFFMACNNFDLIRIILEKNNGSLKSSTAFSSIAEEFGRELYPERKYLRDMYNNKNLDPRDKDNFVQDNHPHALSEVLSGAFYMVMISLYEQIKLKKIYKGPGGALRLSALRLRPLIFRGLDYLPPGEISFADYGRAIIAADQIADPYNEEMRDWIRKEFVRRKIVDSEEALNVQTKFNVEALKDVELSDLYSSDWVAYDFANKNKELFCIPVGQEPASFEVRPRLSVKKRYSQSRSHRGWLLSRKIGHECIFKIAWQHEEPNQIGSGFPQKRAITVGTTLVIDWKTRKILTRLTSAPATTDRLRWKKLNHQQQKLAKDEYEKQREARDKYLSHLAKEGFLEIGKYAIDPTGKPLNSLVIAEVSGDKMHVRNTGNMLHIIGHGSDV